MKITSPFYAVAFFLLIMTACSITTVNDASDTYVNPIPLVTSTGMAVESCADPSVIQSGEPDDVVWTMYCTTDPLSSTDVDNTGKLIFHLIPIFRSDDLVNWTYVGDVFATRPSWVAADAGLWAPAAEFFNGQYYLYYSASNTSLPGGGSAIGVATSDSPFGPWKDSGAPVVEPHAAPCCPGERRWTFDPALITDESGQRYIYYGSYFGGISARKLSEDGLDSDPTSEVQITIGNRYEGSYVVKHGDFYYLFVSATDCCRGPLTGYSVFAGRSENPLGPFVDREGTSLLEGRVGGTPVISMTGNRWVGPGHNAMITDLAGQDWFFYHAIDRNDPYFSGEVGFSKRPVLLDALTWSDGWPTVRAGQWASDSPQAMPVTEPDEKVHNPEVAQPLSEQMTHEVGQLLPDFSTDFDGATLPASWSWVRPPTAQSYGLENGMLRFATQAADLHEESNDASVLWQITPPDDYVVETRVKLDLPAEGCCFNFVQAGLVIYGGDDNYVKLVHVSIWETRQTEFAKEVSPVAVGYPRYGNTVVGTPGVWTYLRIARNRCGQEECYSGYTSQDGVTWVRGGTWTHQLGDTARIGVVSMGDTGFTALFDYVHTYQLEH